MVFLPYNFFKTLWSFYESFLVVQAIQKKNVISTNLFEVDFLYPVPLLQLQWDNSLRFFKSLLFNRECLQGRYFRCIMRPFPSERTYEALSYVFFKVFKRFIVTALASALLQGCFPHSVLNLTFAMKSFITLRLFCHVERLDMKTN